MSQLMKILLLNPSIDAQHKICMQLQQSGCVLLFPANIDEAWKMIQIHSASLDLAIIHREGSGADSDDDGNKLLAKIKADPSQSDLPIVFTSSQWNESDFFQHQKSPLGVNAYLRWPFTEETLIATIETMFGNSLQGAVASRSTVESSFIQSLPKDVVLESPAESSASESTPSSSAPGLEIRLESPDLSSVGEVKFELTNAGISAPPEANDGKTGISLSVSNTRSGGTVELQGALVESPVLELPPSEQLNTGVVADATQPTPVPTLGEPTGSLDISALMNEDLEPHERLMLQQSRAAGPVELEVEKSSATTVLDPGGVENEVQREQVEASEPHDDDLASELPYLFNSRKTPANAEAQPNPALVFAEPVGDAVVPGGAVQSPDMETLKRYLLLREQDVAILSNQLKASKEQIGSLEKQLKEEKGRGLDLTHSHCEQKRRIDEFEKEKALALEGLHAEIEELKFQSKNKSDKARSLESQVREATDEIERLKERVRTDIRKIRVREKELENKLEIVRKDSEALIAARESKIIELKRKIDLLEFNMDLLQDQYTREKENSAQLRERLAKAAQVVRVAGGLLDTPGKGEKDAPLSSSDKRPQSEAS